MKVPSKGTVAAVVAVVPVFLTFLLFVSDVRPASAQVVPAPGYIFSSSVLGDTTQSCVAVGPGVSFVGVGPGFTGQGQSIVRRSPSGGENVVVSGLNSIADCAYDAASDTLYVTDNGLDAAGAITGDTVFAVAAVSTAGGLSAVGLELLPAGSIPAASSVAIDASGAIYVTDSGGAGLGSVLKIPAGVTPPLIENAFDFTAGMAVDAAGNIFVAESLASFDVQISRYDASGAFQEIVSGPTFDHGSYDLAFLPDGLLLVTGAFAGDVKALDPVGGAFSTFASGLNFATGVTVNGLTGRVDILSSTFIFPDPPEEDFSVHSFTPIDRLVAGKGSAKKTCVSEVYGVELVPKKPGKPATQAICTDGAACDADGLADGGCLFPIGFCLNVDDPELPECVSGGVSVFELKKTKPESSAITSTALEIQSDAPVSGSTCYFSDGIRVDVKTTGRGKLKAGKGLVKTKVTSTDAKPLKDSDTIKLVCNPAVAG